MTENDGAQTGAFFSALSSVFAKKISPDSPELLLEELYELDTERKSAYQAFNLATEPELIEAAIYRIKALDAEYAFLTRRARERGEPVRADARSGITPR